MFMTKNNTIHTHWWPHNTLMYAYIDYALLGYNASIIYTNFMRFRKKISCTLVYVLISTNDKVTKM